MKKAELRKIYLTRQRNLSERAVAEKSKSLFDTFFDDINLSRIRFLHIFLPIKRNNEIDTWQLINRIRENFPEIKIVTPTINQSGISMTHYILEEKSQLIENQWGIQEIVSGKEVKEEDLDMVIVPLLCFDKERYRVGYGKGYYDRFLAGCREDVQKIGLSYFPPVPRIEDINQWDIQLDRIVYLE
jgi:5-formyltetrahydrofolate cyclo-ligase